MKLTTLHSVQTNSTTIRREDSFDSRSVLPPPTYTSSHVITLHRTHLRPDVFHRVQLNCSKTILVSLNRSISGQQRASYWDIQRPDSCFCDDSSTQEEEADIG